MTTLVVFLEEQSAKAMLEGLLPRLLPKDVFVQYIPFDGKQDLEKQLVGKLRGWLAPDSCFLVLRDQDAADCRQVKDNLVQLCRESGKPGVMVRIACHELESWYFGDLLAVEIGLGIQNLARFGNKAKYRQPDIIVNPARELSSLTQKKYQKIAGSRAIGPHLDPERNTSQSFRVFVSGVQWLIENCGGP